MIMIRALINLLALLVLSVPPALAGSPHFISCTPAVNGAEVCVSGKEAGLGDEDQVDITLQVVAHCQNPGGNKPKAQNKVSFSAADTAPVQNGKALYEICVTTSFQPSCAPPMTVVVDAVSLFDATNGISCQVSLD
jgi:hypothetical protein